MPPSSPTQTARELAQALKLSATKAAVWAWNDGGEPKIVVEAIRLTSAEAARIPDTFGGMKVVLRHPMDPVAH